MIWMALARRLFVDIKRTVPVTVNAVKLGRYFCHRLDCRCRRRLTENSCEPTSAQWNATATAETDTRGLGAVPCLSGNRNGVDALQRGSGAHPRNGRDPTVDQEVCPDDVRRIVRREVNCQLRDFQRIGHPLAWIVCAEDVLNRLALLFAWEATEHRRVSRTRAQGVHANPAVHELGAEDPSEIDDCGLAGRDGRGRRPSPSRSNA